MQVDLTDNKGNRISVNILKTNSIEVETLKDWKFDWYILSKTTQSEVYKLYSQEIEGLLMIHFFDDEFFELKNIEVAPSNKGTFRRLFR